MTSSGLRRAVINADKLFIFEKEDSSTAINIRVDFYNDLGIFQSTLSAKHGLVRQRKEAFSVWGDVVVKNDSSRLESQSLFWDTGRNLITSDDFVRFERRNDIITGYGLEADTRMENVRILRDVKGRVTDVPQSEEGLDSLDNPNTDGARPQ